MHRIDLSYILRRMNLIKIILLSFCCLAALSCAQQDKPQSVSSNMATPPVSSPPPSPPLLTESLATPEPGDTSAATFEGTAGAIDKNRANMKPAVLTRVRTGKHEGFDRVVFEFAGNAVPGYHVEYVDKPVRNCGAGEVVPLAGQGFLLIRMQPAQAHTEAGVATIKDRESAPNLPIIKELKLICDFEADVQWVAGLTSPNRYRVLELSNPARLVVDVRH